MNKSYEELIKLDTYIKRLEYLKLNGKVGEDTFGKERYLNQKFYKSKEWENVRHKVIARDNGMDLGIDGMEIQGLIYIHHINPITVNDILTRSEKLFDLDNLISVSKRTHDFIHYGIKSEINLLEIIERKPNDTIPWRKHG